MDECVDFDPEIIMHINSTFSDLHSLGVGPDKCFHIEDDISTWSEFIDPEDARFESVKSYIYLKVKRLFDPPSSSTVTESMNRMINEYEWRLNILADS